MTSLPETEAATPMGDGEGAEDGGRRGGRRLPRKTLAGSVALVVALGVLFSLTFLPTSFVIERPGPVYNTIGTAETADGEELPLIEVSSSERTYETGGSLDLTTVQVMGNRERTPSWLELALAWFDPSRAVLPLDAVFPDGETSEQRETENAALMVDSQSEATAAALRALGYEVPGSTRIGVLETTAGSPADGVLEAGDVVTAANGADLDDVDRLREIIAAGEGEPVEIAVVRDGEDEIVSITPERTVVEGEEVWAIGVILQPTTDYDFPVDVTIQLDNVGGPSAGMMFALGIVDVLTPGMLTGGEDIAGTGTIDGDGEVGPIGGIRQKLYGAREADADWFLAPDSNCDEVVGHVPDGLRVVSVGTLDEARAAVEAIADGETDGLPACSG